MALNPFFLQGSPTEQFLIQDLINEHLKIFGVDVYYLPRKFFKTDNIIREVQSSKFDDSFLIEAYLNNYEGYSPGSDLMTKFGISLRNEVILTISRERFEEFITPFMQGMSSGIIDGLITDYDIGNLTTRPREGDLIYFPLGERLFEIKKVEFEKPFYQLGRNYIYELNCELYEYENELIDTSIDEVDNTVDDEGYITTLTLVGSATTATATAFLGGSGMIGQIILNDDGSGYTSIPNVSISTSPSGGTNATAVAITTTKGNITSVKSILITNPGSGYTSTNPPIVSIFGGNGVGAAATAVVVDSGITTFTINRGSGYYVKPTVTISGPSVGVTAIVDPVISNGQVTSLRFVNTGYGYTQAPTVSIAGTSSIGIGTFVYNELVEGQTSGTKARVKEFRTIPASAGISSITYLRVSINNGKFYPGEIVVGGISSATYLVSSYTTDSYDDPYDQNEEIEEEADLIIDFTESNPFGEY
jgi:hypothetical protein